MAAQVRLSSVLDLMSVCALCVYSAAIGIQDSLDVVQKMRVALRVGFVARIQCIFGHRAIRLWFGRRPHSSPEHS